MSSKRGSEPRFRIDGVRFIDPDRMWFVVQCKPSQDRKAGERLIQAGVDVWAPEMTVTVVRRGRKVEMLRRLFASYLFAGIGRDRNGEPAYEPLYDRIFTLGVLGTHGPAEFPADLLQLLAERLGGQERDETEKGQRREAAARLMIGEFRTLIAGPFSSFMAEVTAVLDNGFVRGDVEIFGRKTSVEVDPAWLGAA